MVKKLFYLLSLSLCMSSCNDDAVPYKPLVEYASWGEDIVYNESGKDLQLEVYSSDRVKDEIVVLLIPSGQSDTLHLPSFDFFVSITESSDSLKVKFSDGKAYSTKASDEASLIYKSYELEEKDYWFTLDGKSYLEDRKWPVYRYRITSEIYDAAE